MVLELLINPKKVIGRPWEMVAIGFVYSFISAFLALWVFKNYVSVVMITLTIAASIPFVHNVFKSEEEKDLTAQPEKKLLKEHTKAIKALFFLFVGFVLAFTSLYLFMPTAVVEKMFSAQLDTIITVESAAPTGNYLAVTGDYASVTGNYISPFQVVSKIFLNNIKILIFCLIFSFFYGAGVIFILAWNASVMATAIGSFIRNNLFYAKGAFDYFQVTLMGFLQYILHGIPEIIAYFIGALASGIISFALVNHDFMDEHFKKIAKDVGILVGVAIIILVAAAFIEVFITPLIMR